MKGDRICLLVRFLKKRYSLRSYLKKYSIFFNIWINSVDRETAKKVIIYETAANRDQNAHICKQKRIIIGTRRSTAIKNSILLFFSLNNCFITVTTFFEWNDPISSAIKTIFIIFFSMHFSNITFNYIERFIIPESLTYRTVVSRQTRSKTICARAYPPPAQAHITAKQIQFSSFRMTMINRSPTLYIQHIIYIRTFVQ